MIYNNSEHYRENPYQEVEEALSAGNTPDSVKNTFEARLLCETNYSPPDTEAIVRIQQQLAHLANLGSQVEIAA